MREKLNKKLYDFKNKDKCLDHYINYMLNRTSQMFQYDNLPANIDANRLELRLQQHGYLILCHFDESDFNPQPNMHKLESGVYAIYGGLGGVLDFNQDYTFVTIAHPLLKESKTLIIGEDCVLLRNDSLMEGLLPLLERYCSALVENDITLNMNSIQSRIASLIKSGNDNGYKSAQEFISKIVKGELSIIHDENFDVDNALTTLPYLNNANNTITNLIELEQYLKASMLNELGLSANYNMKRESINSSEAQLGQDSLLPLVDDMLHCREQAWQEANELFGLDVKVNLHSGWEQLHEEEKSEDAISDEVINENDDEYNNIVNTEETSDETKEDVVDTDDKDDKEDSNE